MKYALILLIIVLCGMNLNCIAANSEVKKMVILKDDAINIANKELLKQGFNVTQTDVTADEANTIWNKRFLSDERAVKNNPQISDKLKNRNYWAIYYTPKETERVLGGGAWVFIDKNTGEIILLFYDK